MLYTKKALQMGAIAVGLAAFAGQSSLAESAKKEDSKTSARTETMQVMPELTMASHFVGVPYNQSGVSVSVINPEEFQKEGIETRRVHAGRRRHLAARFREQHRHPRDEQGNLHPDDG